MKIAILAPSIYMSPTKYPDMIFAPRDLAVALADGLVDRGHEVWLFTAPDIKTKAKLAGGDPQLLEHDYVEGKLTNNDPVRAKWAAFYNQKRNYEMDLTRKCYQMAVTEHFDLVHAYHDQMAHFFDDLKLVPTVYTLHDPLPNDENDLNFWLLSRFAAQNYISISNAFRRSQSLKLNYIATIYHGINLGNYPFAATSRDYLAASGRMVPEKGIDTSIKISQETQLPLKIATSSLGANTHLPFFSNIIDPLLKGNQLVQLTGFLTGSAKSDFFGQAKAFLFPIKWEEPFGMVLIEAMACGTPVVAYNRGSVPEIVKDGVTGFIVNEKDTNLTNQETNSTNQLPWVIKKTGIEGLVEAVNRIGEIDRASCRRHVEENFTVEKMVTNHEEVYQKLISSKNP